MRYDPGLDYKPPGAQYIGGGGACTLHHFSREPDEGGGPGRVAFECLFRHVAKEKHAWKIAALAKLAILVVSVVAYVPLPASARTLNVRLGGHQR